MQSETLIGRVDCILCQAETQEQGFDAQNRLKTTDDGNRATRLEGEWLLAETLHNRLLGSLVGGHVGRSNIGHTAMQ